MKFEVYHLTATPEFLSGKKEEIVGHLKNLREYNDKGLKHCLNNIDLEGNIIGGTLSQEYISGLTTVVNKVEQPIEDNPWDKTYFFIDTVTAKILLQRKKYSPKNLNHRLAESRVSTMLQDIMLSHYNSTLGLIKTSIGINNEYFRQIVEKESVQLLTVGNLVGKKITVGTPLHNPREDWDKVWAESWNEYDSEIVEEIIVKASNGKNLSRSVIHKALLAADGDIRTVKFYDNEEEKPITISKSSAGSLFIEANKDDEPVTVMKNAYEKISKSRDVLRRFKLK